MASLWSASPISSSLSRCTCSMDAAMFGISTVGSMMDRHGLCGNNGPRPQTRIGEKMQNTLLSFFALPAVLLLSPVSAAAHHGWAAFASEPGSQITLKGIVKEFHFVNPHSVVELAVKDDKGQVQVCVFKSLSNPRIQLYSGCCAKNPLATKSLAHG